MRVNILPDTSIWVEFLKRKNNRLAILLEDESLEVCKHPMILAELALGGLKSSSTTYKSIVQLKQIPSVREKEMTEFIQNHKLANSGIGYVDACLLASCLLGEAKFITSDIKLNVVAKKLGVHAHIS